MSDADQLLEWLGAQLDADETAGRELAAEAARCRDELKETRLLGTTQVGWGNWPAVFRALRSER